MNNIRNLSNMIATEALSTGLPVTIGTPTFLKVKGIALAIAGWAREKIRPDMRVALVNYARLRSDMEKANFYDLSAVKITVPRGLKGHLNAYVEELFDAFVLVENMNQDLLTPFSTWLSMMIASPGSMATAAVVKDLKGYKEIPVDKAQAALGGFVDPTSRRDTAEAKDVYPSITIMKMTWDNVNALTTRYLETNPTKLLKSVQEIVGKVDRLIHMAEENESTLSGQMATVMARLVAQMAEAVDMYGQLGILIREVAVACSRHTTELEKALSQSAKKTKVVALESLKLGEAVLQIDDHQVDLESLKRIIYGRGTHCTLPIEDLIWVVEEELAQASTEVAQNGQAESMVYVIKYNDIYYPVHNINVIAVANAAGHAGVEAVVITREELTDSLNQPVY